MTITLQEFAKEKKLLPAWMLNHPVFKYPDKIEKIFPNIGLSNCSAQCDLSGNFAMDEAKQFLKNIKAELVAPFDGFEHNKQYPLMSLIQQLENILTDRIDDCIQLVRGEIILKTPEKIVISENRTLAANTDFFTVYQECFLVFSWAGWSLQKWEKIPGLILSENLPQPTSKGFTRVTRSSLSATIPGSRDSLPDPTTTRLYSSVGHILLEKLPISRRS